MTSPGASKSPRTLKFTSAAVSSPSANITYLTTMTPSAVTSSSGAVTSPSSAPSPLSEPVRLWVGNIQPRVAEYQLLRLARPLGTITRFDFMLHGVGPLAGRPRGYAFLSYSCHAEAERARRLLAGAPLGGARLTCRWAHEPPPPGGQEEKRDEPSGGGGVRISAQTQIRAIEAKLLNMTGSEQRFDLSATSADVKRLPKVKGPLRRVNASSKQTSHQAKPYARKK